MNGSSNGQGPLSIVAQLSDVHIVAAGELAMGMVDTAAYLERAVQRLASLLPRPDLVLITGDLTEQGTLPEYEHLRVLLAPLQLPLAVIAGNHDRVPQLHASFPQLPASADAAVAGRHCFTTDAGPLRVVGLDSLLPGLHHGEIGADQLDWLDRTLGAQPARPTLVTVHHPPFPTGITWMDRSGLSDAVALADVLQRHPQVLLVTSGHQHRPVFTSWAGRMATIAPGVAHQVHLDLAATDAPSFTYEPGGFLLHCLMAHGIVSHVVYLDQPDPVAFTWH